MAVTITRDADNKWYTFINFSSWLAKQVTDIGGTVSISSASWNIPAALTEEVGTQVVGDKAVFVGSGGVNGVEYDLVCTITYNVTALSVADMTQDKTITVNLTDQ